VPSLNDEGKAMEVIIQIIINGIAIGSVYALAAIGLTLIFGIIEIVNFAHGEFIMLSMYMAFWFFTLWGVDPYLGMLLLVPLFFLLGIGTERLIIRKVISASPFIQIFVTNGLSLVLLSGALLLWGVDYRELSPSYLFKDLSLWGIKISLCNFIGIIINISAIIILFIFLYKTYIGKAIRAVSQQKRGAMVVGINVPFLYTLSFGIGIAYAAIAGITMSTLFSIHPSVGGVFILVAFVTVIFGGYNSIVGSFIAGLIIGQIEVFTAFYLTSHLKEVMYFVVFVIILLFKPTGLLGHK
jgi:branched-chain amino acid transport system permease protein